MPVITLSREMGSLGTDIARQLAETLGYRLVWREVINEAAARSGAPEMALDAIDDLGLLEVRPTREQRQAYHHGVQQVVTELAGEGNVVIVGRAGQVVLRNYPNVLHTRIIAPLELRIQRTEADQHIATSAAQAQVQNSDRKRRAYVRQAYHVDWDDPELYDLVINTRRLTVAMAVDLIIQALSHVEAPN
jgi:cytidylate kinase